VVPGTKVGPDSNTTESPFVVASPTAVLRLHGSPCVVHEPLVPPLA
jgi:hypothetical protein